MCRVRVPCACGVCVRACGVCVCVWCVCACVCLSQMPPKDSVEPTLGLGFSGHLISLRARWAPLSSCHYESCEEPLTSRRLAFCTTGRLREEDSEQGALSTRECVQAAGLGPPWSVAGCKPRCSDGLQVLTPKPWDGGFSTF